MAIQTATRSDGRRADQLRPLKIETGVNIYAEGSALISAGNTRVLCLATVEEKVPPFRKGSSEGWVTAEYAMLPRATNTRNQRDGRHGRVDGRSQEIQRLIGRSFRAGIDLRLLGERTVTVDCDVLQADAGTRCASITGGYVALYLALQNLQKRGLIETLPIRNFVSAVSVGVVGGEPLLDLNYDEDYRAEVDMNCVATETGEFIEIQGTGEKRPFSRDEGDALLTLAERGTAELATFQRQALGL
ncbi:MAG: ribonuclease PH [Candidatus Dormibacteraeota bacterium]|nr:ribonuclease PH [Candidatus Dormibacteraeota bacterium]